jgi:hypothetical protein
MTAGKRFARDVFAPRQSAAAWATELGVALSLGALLAVLLSGCAAPGPVAWEQLDCLAQSVAAEGAPDESLLAILGDCDGPPQVARR